jgi:crotonobetainyl-CoA:carnitine CoA-transferase CaiB-like acyl-CoA transferase
MNTNTKIPSKSESKTQSKSPSGTQVRRGPLARFKVIDLTRLRSGPTAVRQLGDWGADVIKIETPEALGVSDGWGDSRLGPDFQNLHRNKRSLTLNLKDPEGLAIFKKLADSADVVVENFRPDVKFRLGIDYETLSATNPGLIYASVSGFGQDGPYANRPGYDQIVQGMGGLMAITGLPGQGPVRAGIAVADSSTGLYCSIGILTALLEREESGRGQWVQTSLLESMIGMLDFQAARWLINKEVPEQAGNDHPTSIPTGVFPTSDGHINIAGAGAQGMWQRLCVAVGAEHLLEREEYKTGKLRSANRVSLNRELSAITQQDTTEQWIKRFEKASVACGPIYSMDQVFNDPQTRHLGIASPVHHPELGEIEVVGQPVGLSRTPSQIRTATPARGEQTDEIMHELGYSETEVADLKARLVI